MAITEEKTVEEKNLSFVEQLVEQDLAEGDRKSTRLNSSHL